MIEWLVGHVFCLINNLHMFCQTINVFVFLFLIIVTADVLVGSCVAISDFSRLEIPNDQVITPFSFVAYW